MSNTTYRYYDLYLDQFANKLNF